MKQLFLILNSRSVCYPEERGNKLSPGGTLLTMAQRRTTPGNHGSTRKLRNWVHSLGKLRWLESVGMCTGEEETPQRKVQKSASPWVLLNTKWTQKLHKPGQLLESSKRNLSQKLYRREVWSYPAGDITEPQEHTVEIPEGLQLSRRDKLVLK